MNKNLFLSGLIAITFASNLNAQESSSQTTPTRVTIKLKNDKAADIPKGPFKPTWESIKENYETPQWFLDRKFGIFIHYGVYTVAAYESEWYPRHMYNNGGVQNWHVNKFGPVDKVGYKDLIPMFQKEQYCFIIRLLLNQCM